MKTKEETKSWVDLTKEEDRGVLGLDYGKQFGIRGVSSR